VVLDRKASAVAMGEISESAWGDYWLAAGGSGDRLE
jgi:hypothetical protein